MSGGQTGVDQAALDVALKLGLSLGGWCPRGRRSERGRIPDRYPLQECASSKYWVRTEKNVIDSDGTLILYRSQLEGGTRLTWRMTAKHDRPVLTIDLDADADPELVRAWLAREQIRVLNVAGPRESSAPGISTDTKAFLLSVFQPFETSLQ